MQQENIVQTPYGLFSGVISAGYNPDGTLTDIRLGEKNVLITHAGELIPYYGEDTPRRKYKASVTFHANGMVNAVSLEEQQDILTPIGELPAELVTFYATGELKRIFPLDGKISGFWSEADERGLNIPLSFDFDFSSFQAMLVGICFYQSGDIKSITLFPNEVIDITAPSIGNIRVKNGFSLYESGKLQSLEPAVPVSVTTPIGALTAFDTNSVGINADSNSLRFDEVGRLSGLITSGDKIAVRKTDGSMSFFAPGETESMTEDEKIPVPLRLAFDYTDNAAVITGADGSESRFGFEESFIIYPGTVSGCSSDDCANCSLCDH